MSTHLQSQINEEEYECIPRQQPMRRPAADKATKMISQFFHPQSPKHSSCRESAKSQIETKQLKIEIERLKEELRMERENNRLERQANIVYMNVFEDIKKTIFRKKNSHFQLRIYEIVEELESIFNETKESSPIKNQYETIIEDQSNKIQQLRNKLLESTQNNINAIFNTQLTSQQFLAKEVSDLRKEIAVLTNNQQNQNSAYSLSREEKLYTLIKNYQNLLTEYKNKQQIIKILQDGQIQTNGYFKELRKQLLQTIQATCQSQHGKQVKQLEDRLIKAIEQINIPEKVQPQEDEENIAQNNFLKQIQRLNQTIVEKEVYIEKLRQMNDELENKLLNVHSSSIESGKMSIMEEKIKQRNKRIEELQNTIIDHIGSHNSVTQTKIDFEDYENTLRNYKALLKSLKEENSMLKHKLKNLTMSSQNFTSLEKVNQDEQVQAILSDILIVLLDSKRGGKCQCLEMITDMILESLPHFQDVLVNFGLIESSSNLIALQINEVTNI